MPATWSAVSPDDLLAMPDEGQGFEVVNGELRELQVSKESSRIAGELYGFLRDFVRRHALGWVYPEGTLYRCFPEQGLARRADASFVSFDRMPAEGYEDEGAIAVTPEVVVEVTSPHDVADEVEEKLAEWLSAGVSEVWLVSLPTRTIRVHREDGSYAFLTERDTLVSTAALPGFIVPLAELFRIPAPRKPS